MLEDASLISFSNYVLLWSNLKKNNLHSQSTYQVTTEKGDLEKCKGERTRLSFSNATEKS